MFTLKRVVYLKAFRKKNINKVVTVSCWKVFGQKLVQMEFKPKIRFTTARGNKCSAFLFLFLFINLQTKTDVIAVARLFSAMKKHLHFWTHCQ